MYKHVCKKCGKIFETYKKNSIFCSRSCKSRNSNINKRKNLVGKKFGKLLVVEQNFEIRKCKCKCDCGNETWVMTSNLVKGNTQSCGCLHKNMSHLEGQRFGKLIALKQEFRNNKSGYLCQCDCGNTTWVATSSLKLGRTKSCGCIYNKSIANNSKVKKYIEENYKENTNLKIIERAIKNKQNKNNTSGVKGVYWIKSQQKWGAYIDIQKERKYLGCYTDIESAKRSRKEAEEKYFKPLLDKYIKQRG